jgi:imidazolonepropionase-like amidohydrolase
LPSVTPGCVGEPFAIVGATIFRSPKAPVLEDATLLVRDGRIAAVGRQSEVEVPAEIRVIDGTGLSVLAGFWNVHVHFTEPHWAGADTAAAERLTRQLQTMLTGHGFMHVLDTGSDLANTLALRRRIEGGEVLGPSIRTTGPGFVPRNGTPFYVAPLKLPELTSVSQAAVAVLELLDAGAHGIKLFTASPVDPEKPPIVMPVEIVRAVAHAAHERRVPVIAHPTSLSGVRTALEGGVDLLAHTTAPFSGESWSRELVREMIEAGLAVAPTLELWRFEAERSGAPPAKAEAFVDVSVQQVRTYAGAGGRVLFGTDVGYMTVYDPTGEILLLQRAGLDFHGILDALTTAPAEFFGRASETGRVEPGLHADLVVLEGRPDRDIAVLTRPVCVFREGRRIYGDCSGSAK